MGHFLLFQTVPIVLNFLLSYKLFLLPTTDSLAFGLQVWMLFVLFCLVALILFLLDVAGGEESSLDMVFGFKGIFFSFFPLSLQLLLFSSSLWLKCPWSSSKSFSVCTSFPATSVAVLWFTSFMSWFKNHHWYPVCFLWNPYRFLFLFLFSLLLILVNIYLFIYIVIYLFLFVV